MASAYCLSGVIDVESGPIPMTTGDISEAKRRLPLPDLLRSFGFTPPSHGSGNMQSPLRKSSRNQKSPSFSIFFKNGQWGWKDRSGGREIGGDEITFIEKLEKLSRSEAIERYLKLSLGRKRTEAAGPKRARASHGAAGTFDWSTCTAAFSAKDAASLAKWRGYSPSFITWLHEQRLIGLWKGKSAFPIQKNGKVIGVHYLAGNHQWRYHPCGMGVQPLIIGDLESADAVVGCESQWDAFSIMDRMGWHREPRSDWALIVTRGASNGALAGNVPARCPLYCFPQNDEMKEGTRAGEEWLKTVARSFSGRVLNVSIPPKYKDANDWLRSEDVNVWEAIRTATEIEKAPRPEGEHPRTEGSFSAASIAERINAHWLNGTDRYFLPGRPGRWLDMGPAEFRRIAKTDYGVAVRPREGEIASDMERLLVYINRHRSVDYAISLAGWPAGVYQVGESKVLVRDSPRLIKPQRGDWSTIRALLEGLLSLPGCDQTVYFYAWLSIAIKSLRDESRRPGQALILVGEADVGKSRIQNDIVTPLAGGRNADPKSYFFGRTDFNEELIGSEHWLIEEIPNLLRYDDRGSFAERIKEVVANDSTRLHRKNRAATTVSPWCRLTISVNDDKTRSLPPITHDFEDKVMIFKTQRPVGFWERFSDAPDPRAAYRDRIRKELPAFADFLENFVIPTEIRSRRFGVRHFHNIEVLEDLFEQEPECLLLTMIDRELFGRPGRGRDVRETWEGGSLDLETYLKADESDIKHQAQKLLMHEQSCGQYLARLRKRFPHRIEKPPHLRDKRIWRIHPPGGTSD